RLRALAIAVAVIGAAAACEPAQMTVMPTATPAPLNVRVSLVPAAADAPITVPADEGQFAALGLNVSIEPVTDSNQAVISAATGRFDIVYATLGPGVLNAFNRGSGLKIIAAGGGQPPGHGDATPLLVRSQLIDSGQVKAVSDLKGRKVAVS